MTTPSYTTTFTVNRSPEAAFAAIINPRAWWSGAFEGDSTELGDVFTYRYQDLHYSRQEVTELVPGRRVAWQVLDADLSFLKDRTEWTGTTIAFDIVHTGSHTEVTFTHVGLKPEVECYDICTDAWTSLIQGSLKQLIETGTGALPELAEPAA
ncbi:SRPBCC family protein [Devosia sp. XGJD_8]|uniref:SRPBCC family protein n=1 Tax=Devosia sp. XGJD_8 TaxID=3391187 RepID=UPI0039850614